MRKGSNCSLLKEDNKVIGVNLGSDFCAEHEWGIKGIQNKLGINSEEKETFDNSWWDKIKGWLSTGNRPVFGIEKRRATKGYDRLLKIELEAETGSNTKLKVYGLVLASSWDKNESFKHYERQLYWNLEKDEIKGFWGEDRFLVVLKEELYIDELIEAFKRNDVAIWLGGGGPFKNGGLIISIISKLPQDFIDQMREVDEDHYELQCEAVRTGIYDILKNAGKKYYALSPRWADKTKKEITFWLNPQEQQVDNYGWFTVNDLEEWAEGKGKIPMKKEKV